MKTCNHTGRASKRAIFQRHFASRPVGVVAAKIIEYLAHGGIIAPSSIINPSPFMKRTILLTLSALLLNLTAFAKTEALTELPAALEKAKTEKKLIFVEYGREACGNCQALKKYIMSHALNLPESQFVYVDLNCDNVASSKPFNDKFKVQGNVLPFVVIADSEGNQLASRTGYGTPVDYQSLLKEAKKKASSPKGGSTSTSTGFGDAFKKPLKTGNP